MVKKELDKMQEVLDDLKRLRTKVVLHEVNVEDNDASVCWEVIGKDIGISIKSIEYNMEILKYKKGVVK